MNIYDFWRDVQAVNEEAIPGYFTEDARIRRHCIGMQFTVEEFIRVKRMHYGFCPYEVERVYTIPEGFLTITRVWTPDQEYQEHAISIFTLKDGKIYRLDEYWSKTTPPAQWILDMNIGSFRWED